jgi:hypothetical protein
MTAGRQRRASEEQTLSHDTPVELVRMAQTISRPRLTALNKTAANGRLFISVLAVMNLCDENSRNSTVGG